MDPYDVLQLLALVFLLRCVLDPLTESYHHAPFVVSVAMFEGLRRRGIPVLTLTSIAALLIMTHFVQLDQANLMNAVYLAWALPTIAYLTASSLKRQAEIDAAFRWQQQRAAQPALSP